MTTALGIDLRELDIELARTKKSVETWAKQKTEFAIHMRDAYFHTLQDQSVKLDSLRTRHASLSANAMHVKQRVEHEEQQVKAIQIANASAQQEEHLLQQKVAAFREQITKKEQECSNHEQASMLEESIRKKRLTALKKALSLYSSRLGLDFKQGAEELHLVFTQVTAAQPLRQFVVGVKVQPDKTYEVTMCNPQVDCLPALVTKLNATNDFSEFIKAMRAAFIQSYGTL